MSTLITDKVENAAVQKEKLDTSAYLPHTPWLQFLLVCCLFALWGMAGNLNDILIAQFKKGFDLTDTQTALVQSIFFLGYFFVALPAAALIKRFSYKAAIIIGLCLYALGCFLFVPAAQIMTYGAFLMPRVIMLRTLFSGNVGKHLLQPGWVRFNPPPSVLTFRRSSTRWA